MTARAHRTPIDIYVPSGIGDISWIYSKISILPRQVRLFISGEGYQRSLAYVKLLPNVHAAQYVPVASNQLYSWDAPETYAELVDWPEDKKCPLIANKWLEEGNRLDQFLKDSPTDHYYSLKLSQKAHDQAEKILKDIFYPVGIFMASIPANIRWDGWGPEEWINFLRVLHDQHPFMTFVFLGAYWDVGMFNLLLPYLKLHHLPYINLISKTDLETTLVLLDKLKLLIGFASGLHILNVRGQQNTVMFYPEKLEDLMLAWPPTKAIIEETYIPMLWTRPITAVRAIQKMLRRSLAEAPDSLVVMPPQGHQLQYITGKESDGAGR